MSITTLNTDGFRIAPTRIRSLFPYVGGVANHVGGVEDAAVSGFVYEFKGGDGGIIPTSISKKVVGREGRRNGNLHADVIPKIDA